MTRDLERFPHADQFRLYFAYSVFKSGELKITAHLDFLCVVFAYKLLIVWCAQKDSNLRPIDS
jgi:hypothetical protein